MLGIIGGSGLNAFTELTQVQEHKVITPYGEPSSSIIVGHLQQQTVAFLARHGRPHRIPPHCINYRANIWALHSIGVKEIIAVNAVGGIADGQEAGVVSIPHQIIDYSYGRQHTFSDSHTVPLQHIDFSNPYSESLRQQLLAAASVMALPVLTHATHAITQGPRLETAGEIRRLANDGCDIVGMTGMPEAALAREMALDFACIALVVNKAAGLTEELITIAAMEKVMHDGMQKIRQLIATHCAQKKV